MASVQDVLLLKAAEDAAQIPSMQTAAAIGSGLGATVGILGGNDAVRVGDAFNRMIGRQPPLLKPGPRMAGGLVGLILGGGLGAGVRQMMINDSPAATLLAKLQAGTFTDADKIALQQVLAETYSQMGLA